MERKEKGIWLPILLLLLCPALFLGLAGCGEEEESHAEYSLYYVNKEKTKTVAVGYEPQAEDARGMVQEFLDQLFRDTDSPDIRKAAPKGVELLSWKLENSQIYLYFNGAYAEMDNVSEVLCRAAFVLSLTEVEGVY